MSRLRRAGKDVTEEYVDKIIAMKENESLAPGQKRITDRAIRATRERVKKRSLAESPPSESPKKRAE